MFGDRAVVAGEVLVRFRTGMPAHTVAALDLRENEALGGGVRRLRSRRANVTDLIAALSRRPDVIYVEPNYLIEPVTVPSDPLFPLQTALFNRSLPGRDLHVPDAWTITTGARRVVAVIDSGVDLSHPDLGENVWTAPAPFSLTLGGTTLDCPAGTRGIDVIALTCDPSDDHGHGTVMAGVIGATGNNGVGVAGVAWSVTVLPIKFIHAGGTGSYSDAIRAIEAAAQLDAIFAPSGAARIQVISASWRGTGSSQALSEAVGRAADRDMLIVAAAGNDGADIDAAPVYPASLPAENILTVGATSPDDSHASYSNFGPLSVDIAAPGLSYSTVRGGGYDAASGTSSATAAVSGVAALVLSRCTVTTASLKSLLLASVDPVDGLSLRVGTGGRLNAARAVEACRGTNTPPSVALTAPAAQQTFTTSEAITLSADAFDIDGPISYVDFHAHGIWLGRDTTYPFELNVGPWPAGTYRLTAIATDAGGAAATAPAVGISVHAPASDAGLADAWRFDDVGPTGAVGYASGGTTLAVAGAGADVWGTSDAFAFVHQPLVGDGEIVARVTSVDAVASWTKAGVMLRESLAPDAAHAFMLVSAAHGAAFQRRDAAGDATAHTGGEGSAPMWVRLERRGSTVTASSSPDGANWNVIDTQSVGWGTALYAGVAVTSHEAGVLATAVFEQVAVRRAPSSPGVLHSALPDGWHAVDVGDVGVPGSAGAQGGVVTLTGAGADIWGTADGFQFAYQPLTGDGEVIARVAALQGPDAWTKAGVMLRASLDPAAAHAFALVSLENGTAFQRRTAEGAASDHTWGPPLPAPVWLRLVRAGPTVSAFMSADGATWSLIGSDTIALEHTVYAGLAVTSHEPSMTATASFDGVVVRGAAASGPLHALPDGWSALDIGAVGVAGTSRADEHTFTVTGAGADIWGASDAFQFAYTVLPADGVVTARVVGVDPVASWTKAGVMLRGSLEAGAAHATMLVSAGKGLAFQRRAWPDGETTHTAGPPAAAPQWVRLVREGGWVTALVSSDGVSWLVVGADAVAFNGPVYGGLAVSSHNAGQAATAVFTGVQVR